MPIYEYRCSACDQVFEALQRLRDAPLDACRDCGGPARRLISSPAIRFVGTGWYVTDYARKGEAKKDGARRNGEKSSGGSGSSDGGNDAKPASAKGGKDGSPGGGKASSAASGGSS